MPFEGRTLFEAGRAFCDHLNAVLARTVTQTRLVAIPPAGRRPGPILVTFYQGGQFVEARLATRFGPLQLYLGQLCEGGPVPGGLQRLHTSSYRYTLTPEDAPEPLLRWEYVKTPPPGAWWCRHHLQGPVSLSFARGEAVALNELHLPTGYVPIEEVLRFCIADLGVPPLSPNWNEILQDSYTRFRRELAEDIL